MLSQEIEILKAKVPEAEAVLNEVEAGEPSITVKKEHIKKVCQTLKETPELRYHVLQVISGVDYPEFVEVNYILGNFIEAKQLILKANIEKTEGEDLPKIDSVCDVWSAANFQERETYDLVGVEFVGHPDHRRILCPYDWTGHALRKDYVAEEYYHGMKIYPEEKSNKADREYADIVKAEEKQKLMEEKKRAAELKAKEEAEQAAAAPTESADNQEEKKEE